MFNSNIDRAFQVLQQTFEFVIDTSNLLFHVFVDAYSFIFVCFDSKKAFEF